MSDLDDIYADKLLGLAAAISRTHRLSGPDVSASAHSRLCGSTVRVDLCFDDGRISDFGQEVKACLLGQASASVVAREIVGTSVEEFRDVAARMRAMLKENGPPPEGRWADLALLEPVRDYRARHPSTLLVFDAVEQAIDKLEAGEEKAARGGGQPIAEERHSDMARVADSRQVDARRGSIYPHPFHEQLDGRLKRKLGDLVGVSQFGVNLVTLEPGAWSSQRHWHEKEDEFVYIIAGEATLVTDDGEQKLGPGMFAGFPAGEANAHRLANNTEAPVIYLEIGSRAPDERADYPDVDMKAHKVDGRWVFTRNDGTPY